MNVTYGSAHVRKASELLKRPPPPPAAASTPRSAPSPAASRFVRNSGIASSSVRTPPGQTKPAAWPQTVEVTTAAVTQTVEATTAVSQTSPALTAKKPQTEAVSHVQAPPFEASLTLRLPNGLVLRGSLTREEEEGAK